MAASAPEPDATWEYHASKQASPKLMGLEIGSWRFDLEEMRAIASWDRSRRRVDVKLWHPQFAGVPESARIQAGFIFLDSLLGEDDVERWVGQIDFVEAPDRGPHAGRAQGRVERRASEPSAMRRGCSASCATRAARSPSCPPMPVSSGSIIPLPTTTSRLRWSLEPTACQPAPIRAVERAGGRLPARESEISRRMPAG